MRKPTKHNSKAYKEAFRALYGIAKPSTKQKKGKTDSENQHEISL